MAGQRDSQMVEPSLGNLRRHIAGSTTQGCKSSIINTFKNDPAPRKNHYGTTELEGGSIPYAGGAQ